jgi:hypothetical protein
MNGSKIVVTLILLVVLMVGISGCNSQGAPVAEPTAVPASDTSAQEPLLEPEAVTQAFFDWYLLYSKSGNTLVDRAYHDSPYLTADLVNQVDEIIADFGQGGYDPFLCAQDIPGAVQAAASWEAWQEEGGAERGEAAVNVSQIWNPGSDFESVRDVLVHLVTVDGRWLINEIICPVPTEAYPQTPDAVVVAFYNWYLDYAATSNPLVDQAYHESPYLTVDFAQHVDEIIAGFDRGGYDPFLCAQDVPDYVMPHSFIMNGPTPNILVYTSFVDHFFTVDLRQAEGDVWQISNVTCGGNPAGNAQAFYTWYLGYIGDPTTLQFRNPLVDGAYRESGFLTAAFIEKVDETIAGFDQGGFDPFLLAQDIPTAFSVDPGCIEDTAIVGLSFGPQSIKRVQVNFVRENGRLLIDDIVEAVPPEAVGPELDTSAWQTYTDVDYGFTFRYPAEWVMEPLLLDGPGMPDDWPVVSAFLLMPPDIAAELADRTGPPDANAPVIVAPFSLEVIVGDQDAFDRVNPTADVEETAVINDHTVLIRRSQPGVVQVVWQPPDEDQVWIVFHDVVTEFPGREEAGQSVVDILFAMMETVTFE